jgi:hypothetical protein
MQTGKGKQGTPYQLKLLWLGDVFRDLVSYLKDMHRRLIEISSSLGAMGQATSPSLAHDVQGLIKNARDILGFKEYRKRRTPALSPEQLYADLC